MSKWGDDCKSTATCPGGTSIVKCTSEPENAGDGASIEGNTCVAWTGPAAVAKCSSTTRTFPSFSGLPWLHDQVVTAECFQGDDCKSTASCSSDTSVVKCSSIPENVGDGILIENNTCVAWTGPAAVAQCSSTTRTFVSFSGLQWLQNQVVTAECSQGNSAAIECTCWCPWRVGNGCGGQSRFSPSDGRCSKAVGSVNGGRGVRIYAICDKTEIEKSGGDIVVGLPCEGDDCKSTASCPSETSVVKCSSTPENDGDGLSIEGNTCVAWTGPAALALCSSTTRTFPSVSGLSFLRDRVVTAECFQTKAIACTCWCPWRLGNGCGGQSRFSPSNGRCRKNVRGVKGGNRKESAYMQYATKQKLKKKEAE
eukprot:TRINITY_DN5038_c0_g1_i8.p1 TRINITY_DN5038_c0_g1~~TRINITY_DN5038_c0_g1_i8.p1  ORF type:complete len:367 (-),score=49.83 TRINITY_DN5038_c0_g1_i8:474-1574(-)